MDELTVAVVGPETQSEDLDRVLWEVLWQPIGLPRGFRHSLKPEGECTELVVKAGERIVGGLVADWTDGSAVEIRHIALRPDVQNRGAGSQLVLSLISIASGQGSPCIRTVARSTSVGFFTKLGFRISPAKPPRHPDFEKHGITFVVMERDVA